MIKDSPFDNASKKLLFQAFNSYFYVFDLDRPLVYVLFIIPFVIIPGVIISCWRPKKWPSRTQTKCCLCSEKCLDLEKEILRHVRVLPQNINSWSKFFLNCCSHDDSQHSVWSHDICKFGRNSDDDDSQHSVCGHAICVLWSVASVLIMGPIFAVIVILVYLFVSFACIIAFSPCTCFVIMGFRYVREKSISKGLLFTVCKVILLIALVCSAISVFLVVAFSMQFLVRTFGFVIMGITLNAESAVPYVTFLFVVWRNIHLCYRSMQNKYKEVKTIISEQWKEVTEKELSTIPINLFWEVCNDFEVLPVVCEIFLMLRNIVFIVVFLTVALTAILLFKVHQVYNSSAIVSSIAVFFEREIVRDVFHWSHSRLKFYWLGDNLYGKKVARAIKAYRKKNNEGKSQRSVDIADSPRILYEAAV